MAPGQVPGGGAYGSVAARGRGAEAGGVTAGKVVAIVATTSRRGREGGERESGREPGAGNREAGRPRAELRYPWSVRREA